MIKVGYYVEVKRERVCDSCDKPATRKIYAIKGEERIGIRSCDDCLSELKENLEK